MPKIIEAIKYFECGYCTNNLKTMFKGEESQKINFGAGVFLMKHRDQGYILYDTGYSPEIYQKTWLLKIYRQLNPTVIEEKMMIDQQLIESGIQPEEIKLIILSHLHPDHIGGLKRFPKAKILISEAVFATYQKPKLGELVLKNQLPSDFEGRVTVLKDYHPHTVFPYLPTVDLFQDQSILVSVIDGHAKGQLCLYLKEYDLFIAADTCWGIDLLSKTQKIRVIPSLIQSDMRAYRQGVEKLEELLAAKINVIVSHDSAERIRGILDGE